jgi:NADH-quinone oxidoreductase subunit G
VADVPGYFADPLVRRAESLQRARSAAEPMARMNAATLQKLGLTSGQTVRVKQEAGVAELVAALDTALPDDCVRVCAAHPKVADLGAMHGAVTVEPV